MGMARIRLEEPRSYSFSTKIPIRITDLNYGGHVGNDTILSIIHEARMQFLKSLGYSELEMEGVSLIMSDVAIEFRAEVFYGDIITAKVQAGEVSRAGFELLYRLEKEENKLVTLARTGMVCFNYTQRKVSPIPEAALLKLKPAESSR